MCCVFSATGKNSLTAHESPEVSLPGCSSFEKLRSVREMEYELDFVTNRANRDTQVCSTPFDLFTTGKVSHAWDLYGFLC